MTGHVVWWNPAQEWGRIKETNQSGPARTFFFRRAWVVTEAQSHTFMRDEEVTFDGDRQFHEGRHRRVAYRVKPVIKSVRTNTPR